MENLHVCLHKFALGGPKCNQTFLRAAAPNFSEKDRDFPLFFSLLGKMMQRRVALGLTLNIFQFNLGASLTVLNPDFNPKVWQDMLGAGQEVGQDSLGGWT